MITKEQYDKMMDRMSVEPCGFLSIGTMTIKECNPPTPDNKKCGICGKYLWKD